MLSETERKRYHRHLILPEFGAAAQNKLKNAKILVVGAGGLGCPALLYLTAAGVGTIGIIDSDQVTLSNLQRQVLYSPNDIGKKKVDAAKARLNNLNEHIVIHTYPEPLQQENALKLISDYDLVIDGTDNFATRYLINDACVITGKPFIYGSIFKFEGQVSVFNYADGPTYRCLFPTPPDPGSVPACGDIGVLGVLPGLIGTYQATEAIKVITDIGTPLSGQLLLINTLNNQQQSISFSANPKNKQITELLDDYPAFCGIRPNVIEMEWDEAKLLESQNKIQLIDVREEEEYNTFNIGGILYPLSQFDSKTLLSIVEKSDLPPLFVCKSGIRSYQAAQQFAADYSWPVYTLKGGIRTKGSSIS